MGEEREHAVVVEHAGKSYVRVLRSNYWLDEKLIAVNGVCGLPKAPGDDSFLVYDGTVETLERITPPKRIVIKYELRPDLVGSPKPPLLSVDEYHALPEADQGLYGPVWEDVPRQAEPIEFWTQKENGPPSKLPRGVVCTDRNSFARFPSFHHLGPVAATKNYMLWRTAKRVEEIIANNPLVKWSSGWGRDVDEYLTNSHRDSFFIEVRPMSINGIEVKAQGLHTMYTTDEKDRGLSYGAIIRPVHGDNLEDLEQKVAAEVERLTGALTRWAKPSECPCCKRPLDPPKRAPSVAARAKRGKR